MPLDSSRLLSSLGYDFYSFREPPEEPELAPKTFGEILPGLGGGGPRARALAGARLYSHQLRAIEALGSGRNVVLVSGSGSGKTEAWFAHAASSRVRALAVYPTLALANDQLERLRQYCEALGLRVDAIDSVRRRELFRELRGGVSSYLSRLDVLVTNPAFLMHDLKKWASGGRPLLYGFCSGMGLLVVDELDFYGPREVALLLSMMRVMRLALPARFRVAVLTATLGNPRELAAELTRITGFETEVISGSPFRVENRVYVVMGRDLRPVWEEARRMASEVGLRAGEDVMRALEDFEVFKREVYKVLEALRASGASPPRVEVDPAEIVAEYASDEGTTLVFTRSIKAAEELFRRIKAERPEAARACATHHHMVSKRDREEIERAAREGRVRVLISPRTLAQGIDIGTVVRVVHLGLPESVREFRQREGRKGRRRGIPFTETVIVPRSPWDRELLLRGADALRAWVQLPLERVVVNPANKYSLLFEGLFKMNSPSLRRLLTRQEVDLLRELGLLGRRGLTPAGRRAWNYLNFYEFGPPFGMKRVMVGDGESYLEDVGHCDLVERLQPGCIDYSSGGLVVDLLRKGRVTTGVVEAPLSWEALERLDFLSHSLEEYRKVKARWGEPANPVSDYYRGRLHTGVAVSVDPPTGGFGLLRKAPSRVYWEVLAPTSRPVVSGGRTY
ncbi:MAG: hypothetical protein DRO06_03290, partial [Thermoproteota archaeon]